MAFRRLDKSTACIRRGFGSSELQHLASGGDGGVQEVKVKGPNGIKGKGETSQDIPLDEGGTLRADLFEDPFFFDLAAFLAVDFCSGPGGTGTDFFAGLNVSAIVLEVPSSSLGPDNIGVWARTMLDGDQIDRMGRPAISTVFIPNNPFEPVSTEPSQKNAFNEAEPEDDQDDFRAEIVDTLTLLFSLNDGTDDPSDDAAAIEGLADILLPDILTIDTSSSAGFLNGRQLADDVIDAELGLITEGLITTDCVDANDVAFPGAFPYLAEANLAADDGEDGEDGDDEDDEDDD